MRILFGCAVALDIAAVGFICIALGYPQVGIYGFCWLSTLAGFGASLFYKPNQIRLEGQ